MQLNIKGKTAKDQEWVDRILGRVQSFKFTDKDSGMDTMELTLANDDLALLTDDLLDAKSLIVAWGDNISMVPPREITLTNIKGFDTLLVKGNGKLWKGDLDVVNFLWKEVSYSAIVREVTKKMGYPHADIEDPDIFLEEDIQQKESNSRFLARLARRVGYAFWTDANNIHWKSRSVTKAPRRKIVYKGIEDDGDMGVVLGKPSIEIGFSRNKPKTVKTVGTKQAPITGKSKSSSVKMGKTKSGKRVLDSTSNQGGNLEEKSTREEKSSTYAEKKLVPAKHEQKKYSARRNRGYGKWKKQNSDRAKIKISVVGDIGWVPGETAELINFSELFAGKFWVRQVVHFIDKSGFRQELTFSRTSGKKTGKKSKSVKGKINTGTTKGQKGKIERKKVILDSTSGSSGNIRKRTRRK